MKHIVLLVVFLGSLVYANAQYKEAEHEEPPKQVIVPKKYPKQEIFPKTEFDSIAAKQALGKGNVTLKGIMFTSPRTNLGIKVVVAEDRIMADHLVVTLFPLTPYYEEWYHLTKKKRNLEKNKLVSMSAAAARYKLTCETNSQGEFTFPNMLPGKYILYGTMTLTYFLDTYYNGTYYTAPHYYDRDRYDSLMDIVEIKPEDSVVKVNLRSSIGLDR